MKREQLLLVILRVVVDIIVAAYAAYLLLN